MPCDDFTEQIHLIIDKNDKLVSYKLIKKSCRGILGQESLLINKLKGFSTKEILAKDINDFRSSNNGKSEVEEFIEFKHFFAIKSALETMEGIEPGGLGSPCTIAVISHDGENLILDADIAVDLIAEKIKACGICAGCGARKWSDKKIRPRLSKSKKITGA